MRNYIIKLNDELGKRLNLTSDQFEDAFAWDCRPSYLGFVRLKPKTEEALRRFFELGKNIYSTIVITAPTKDIIEMSKEYNYEYKIDVAGTPYLTDEDAKTCSRQHLAKITGQAKQ